MSSDVVSARISHGGVHDLPRVCHQMSRCELLLSPRLDPRLPIAQYNENKTCMMPPRGGEESPGYKLQVSSKMKIFCFFSVIMGTKSRIQMLGGLGVLRSEILKAKNPNPDTVCYLLWDVHNNLSSDIVRCHQMLSARASVTAEYMIFRASVIKCLVVSFFCLPDSTRDFLLRNTTRTKRAWCHQEEEERVA